MRLHIDGIIFSLQQYGGITVYFRELLSRFRHEHQTTLTLEAPCQQGIDSTLFPSVRCVERAARWQERLRPARVAGNGESVFHSSYYRRPERCSIATVVTVHDFVYQRFVRGPRGWARRWLMNSAIEQAQHIICISEATRQDLLEFVPMRSDQRVSVIHNGVSDVFRLLDVRQEMGSRPYILFIGQRGGYKNFDLALRALSLLPDLELHCVGGGPLRGEELAGLDQATLGRVRHLGFVSDEQLNELYNAAFCLLYPSSYEGFGIPVLEAMRAGCPVVSIDSKAVVEVGGSALCVSEHPSDPEALAQAVLRLDDNEERKRLRAIGLSRSQQFSWDQCFEQTLAVYRGL
jgi:mannosyltransferase